MAADPLALPSKEKLREIAAKQDAKEKKIIERRERELRDSKAIGDDAERRTAAEKIQVNHTLYTHPFPPTSSLSKTQDDKSHDCEQRNYRGYRERRQLKGYGLSPSDRWSDVSTRLPQRERRKYFDPDTGIEDRYVVSLMALDRMRKTGS